MKPEQAQGFETPDDKKVTITQREWNAMKLALWRSKGAWETVTREATVILDRCEHVPDCSGAQAESAPCSPGCRDREKRLSALVILNSARQFAPVDAKKLADGPYFAPSREHFSAVIAELATIQVEIEELRAKSTVATKEVP